MGDYKGARPAEHGAVPVHALNDQIYSIFGAELVVLSKAESDARLMAIKVEVGSFRFKVGIGDTDDNMAAPTETDVVNGLQSMQFVVADGIQYLSRNSEMTIQGESGSDILTYWFV